MDASSKPGESTDSQPSRSDSRVDSQKLSHQEKTSQASSSSGIGTLIGSSHSSVGGISVRTPSPPKINLQSPQSFSQDVVTNSSCLVSTSRTLPTTSTSAVETKIESPTPSSNSKDSENNVSVTLISGKATPAPGLSTTPASTIGNTSNIITLSSTTAGMKRPPSDTVPTTLSQNTSLAAENPDSDSNSDPKRKKMRKELKTETADSSMTGISSISNVSTASSSCSSANRSARGATGNKQGKPSASLSTSGLSGTKSADKPSTSASAVGSPANSGGNCSNTGTDSSFNRPDAVSSGPANNNPGMVNSWEGQSQAVDTSESSSNSTEEISVSFSGGRVKQTEAGTSTSAVSGTSTGPSGTSGNGCPKVPPIKIVLQSHAHGNLNAGHCLGSACNAGGNAAESESTTSTQHAASTGFPYVVSSTTDNNTSSTNVNPTSSTPSAGGSSVPTASSTSFARGSSPNESSHINPNVQTAGQFSSGSSTNTSATNVSVPVSTTSNLSASQDISSTDQQTAVTTVPTSTTQPETNTSNVPTHSFAAVSSSSISNSGLAISVSMAYASPSSSGASITSTGLASQTVNDKSALSSCPTTLNAPSSANPVTHVADRDKDKPCSSNKELAGTPGGNLLSSNIGKDDRMKESSSLKGSTCFGQAGTSTMSSTNVLMSVSGGSSSSSGSFTDDKEKEKPQRVTRSSHRMAHNNTGTSGNAGGNNSASSSSGGTPSSPPGAANSPKNSNCPSPSQQENGSQPTLESSSFHAKQQEIQEKLEAAENSNVDVHPRKRKIKVKEVTPANSSSSSTSGEINDVVQNQSSNQPHDQPILNCFEMYLNIRKQIERRRKNLFPVTPKPPQGFKDYLMNRGTYVLASNDKSRVAIPLLNPPSNLPAQMKDTFIDQEKERHKLRIQHLVEKEKLVLSVEQEILRVHGRAARALSNQALPFSVCTILKDQEVYNLLTPEQEEKDRNARSRYNGRLFLSWLQDVDDKWDKIKESMLLRHHNEAESLHAVQKMDWEWKLKEVGLCEPKAAPSIDDIQVPMVHVSDDFDLLPA